MIVFVKPSGPNSKTARSTQLNLPASKAEILQSLDFAKVPYGSGEYQIQSHRDSPGFVKKLLNNNENNPTLAEMNHLAERMAQLSEDELHTLGGVMKTFPGGEFDIADAIDATHNLERFSFYPGVADDYTLGEVAIGGHDGIYPPIAQVPDELIDRLDSAKVGELVRCEDGGAFTGNGYVVPESKEWDTVYDRSANAERAVRLSPDEPIISLQLRPCDYPEDKSREFRIDLPVTQPTLDAELSKHGVQDGDCFIHEAKSVISALDYALPHCEATVEQVNDLATAIKVWCMGGGFAKYKAAYEMETVSGIESAITLAKRLHEYDFEQHPSTEAFGIAAMAKTGADVNLLTEYGFDFGAYGCKVMDEQNIRFVSYGFISHPRGQTLSMEQTPEPEQKRPIEPTMSI